MYIFLKDAATWETVQKCYKVSSEKGKKIYNSVLCIIYLYIIYIYKI